MLNEQDARAVEAMVRCNMELDELCELFPTFQKEDLKIVMQSVLEEGNIIIMDLHSVN